MAPKPKYPWADWLDGDDKTIRAGRDFPASVRLTSLGVQIRQRAKEDGVEVSVRRTRGRNDELRLVFGDDDELLGRYPWDTLLDGQLHVLTFDEISARPESFRRYAWAVARDHDKKIAVTVRPGQRLIGIRAIGPYKPTRSVASYAPSNAELDALNAAAREQAQPQEITVTPFGAYVPPRIGREFPEDEDFVSAERPA